MVKDTSHRNSIDISDRRRTITVATRYDGLDNQQMPGTNVHGSISEVLCRTINDVTLSRLGVGFQENDSLVHFLSYNRQRKHYTNRQLDDLQTMSASIPSSVRKHRLEIILDEALLHTSDL